MFETTISRRAFLKGLVAIGAAIALPDSEATDAQIQQVWGNVLREPITFEVDEYQTISVPWAHIPEINADIYQDINLNVTSNKALLAEIEDISHLSDYFAYEFEVLADDPEDNPLVVQIINEGLGWEDWVLMGDLQSHKDRIEAWLKDGIDWEYAPLTVGPVGEAYQYFNNFAWSTHEDLGVVVVEGEHPGSSYFAAELRVAPEEANRRAEALGLPIRFNLV